MRGAVFRDARGGAGWGNISLEYCVSSRLRRFEGLKMRGAADKLMGTLDRLGLHPPRACPSAPLSQCAVNMHPTAPLPLGRELDVALLRGDVARLAAALDEVAMVRPAADVPGPPCAIQLGPVARCAWGGV